MPAYLTFKKIPLDGIYVTSIANISCEMINDGSTLRQVVLCVCPLPDIAKIVLPFALHAEILHSTKGMCWF